MESTQDYRQSILDTLCEQSFNQILEHNNEKSLDVFLCNGDENVHISKEDKVIESRYNVSNHPAYIITIQLTVNRWTPVKLHQVYSLKSANWESFVTATLENPFQPYCYSNVDVLHQTWYHCSMASWWTIWRKLPNTECLSYPGLPAKHPTCKTFSRQRKRSRRPSMCHKFSKLRNWRNR